jgi:SAM-dependent methyltransferase
MPPVQPPNGLSESNTLKPFGSNSANGALDPNDWDNYEASFTPSHTYADQESALHEILLEVLHVQHSPRPLDVLEIGPGFGRITKLLLDWLPIQAYYASDVSQAALSKSQAFAQSVKPGFHFTGTSVGRIQDTNPPALEGIPPCDLVVAVEVLMHVPPDEVQEAIEHLLIATAFTSPPGVVVTCDWTEPLPPDQPIRVGNYCHDYPKIFRALGGGDYHLVLTSYAVGRQTIYVFGWH